MIAAETAEQAVGKGDRFTNSHTILCASVSISAPITWQRQDHTVSGNNGHMFLTQDTVAICLLGFHGFQMIGPFGKELVSMGLNVTVENQRGSPCCH